MTTAYFTFYQNGLEVQLIGKKKNGSGAKVQLINGNKEQVNVIFLIFTMLLT